MKTTLLPLILGSLATLSSFAGIGTVPALEIDSESSALPAPAVSGQTPVPLGRADFYSILSKAGISTTGTTTIRGNIGVSPIDSTGITGFGLVMHSSSLYSTSSLVAGKVFAADYAARTRRVLTASVLDMETAYTDAAGRTLPDFTELGAGDIGGMTLAPGLYKWGTGVLIPSNGVTLAGNATDVWIFQIAQDLTVSNGAQVTLTGGAQAKRVFWQVAGNTTLGTTSDFSGIILCQTDIALQTGAKLTGKALAQTAVTLDASIVKP
ncbi:MAG TPA: ice-binding family protein [Planctomycetota bacterium]|nr:ice-binding family protein [Planctomycetota bacterium]